MINRPKFLESIRRELVRTVTRTPRKALAKITGRPWPPVGDCSEPDNLNHWNGDAIEAYNVPRYNYGLRAVDAQALIGRDDPVILEIGANEGQDSRQLLKQFARINLFCFEPEPRAIAKFKQQAFDSRCTLVEQAVAAKTGTTTFWQSNGDATSDYSNWDQSGSIHRPTGHIELAPEVTFNSTIEVPTVSLDDWMQERPELDRIDLLWMDTQGAEHDVIVGGAKTLPKVRFLYSEFYQRPMYEGQRNLDDLLAMLPGFSLIGIYAGCNFLARNEKF